ncbi:hypothetical protein [Hyalangium sp.]|uniref:hypothetical protein n=1 Tax=Hyalangium sp. TaxID=2028555 RepID=UPI002D593A97|nr:hypothetical protein [Hyalangium sp.]HYI02165.1 hypothetical protein [Hyalangium sp.]
MRHFILAGGVLALAGCGTMKSEVRPDAEVAFTCRGRPPPPRTSISHSDAPVGRLDLKRLSYEPPSAVPGDASSPPPAPASATGARLPETRFRLVAEAVPLGSLGAALASELGFSVVVAAPLVDLRVSLALPDTDTARLLGLLRAHYGVGSTYAQGVLSLEEREELLERLLLVEPAPIITQLVPVDGLPAEQIASAWCEQAASSRGMASVIGGHLLVKDSEERIRILGRMIGALRGIQSLADGQSGGEPRPDESPGVDLEP